LARRFQNAHPEIAVGIERIVQANGKKDGNLNEEAVPSPDPVSIRPSTSPFHLVEAANNES